MDEEFYVLAFNFNGLCVFEQKIMCACVCVYVRAGLLCMENPS